MFIYPTQVLFGVKSSFSQHVLQCHFLWTSISMLSEKCKKKKKTKITTSNKQNAWISRCSSFLKSFPDMFFLISWIKILKSCQAVFITWLWWTSLSQKSKVKGLCPQEGTSTLHSFILDTPDGSLLSNRIWTFISVRVWAVTAGFQSLYGQSFIMSLSTKAYNKHMTGCF